MNSYYKLQKLRPSFWEWFGKEASWGYGTILVASFFLPIFSAKKPDLLNSILQVLVSSDLVGASLCFLASASLGLEKSRYGLVGSVQIALMICAFAFLGMKSFPIEIPNSYSELSNLKFFDVAIYVVFSVVLTIITIYAIALANSDK